jgi:hypothetical protein
MRLTVKRDTFSSISTTGRLLIDGVYFCYSLEPPRTANPPLSVQLIPEGIYRASLAVSPKWSAKKGYPFRVPLLQGVPSFEAIEIHIGNTRGDTEGCTLVGYRRGIDFVEDSENAFFHLYHRLPADYFEVSYENG